MLDAVYGSTEQGGPYRGLLDAVRDIGLSGTLYFCPSILANPGGPAGVDALLVSDECGLVAFDLSAPRSGSGSVDEWMAEIENRQDEMHRNLHAALLSNQDLVSKRQLAVIPEIITIVDECPAGDMAGDVKVATFGGLRSVLSGLAPLPKNFKRALNATIQGIAEARSNSNGAEVPQDEHCAPVFRKAADESANLDRQQLQAALSFPNGPQRIHGVAGSGKTTILALKAVHLHVANPEWDIAVVHRNANFVEKFRYLIRKFMKGMNKGEPNWSKLSVLGSRGDRSSSGFYDEVVRNCGLEPVSWLKSNGRNGADSFGSVCDSAIEELKREGRFEPLYDAVLIDDAQDLPASFLRLAYVASKDPKRVVWTYDELQSLDGPFDLGLETPFSSDANGAGDDGSSDQKVPSPQECMFLGGGYRCTPWALCAAHALGCGIYRDCADEGETPLFQVYDHPGCWREMGYDAAQDTLDHGKDVSLTRREFRRGSDVSEQSIRPDDAIAFRSFETPGDQAEWMAESIERDISQSKLQPHDILIVLPEVWITSPEYLGILSSLGDRDINSHLVGVVTNRDPVFRSGSVAISNVFRARECDVPVVYFANVHECCGGSQMVGRRNRLFTGITRSNGRVRICGIGEDSRLIENEFRKVLENSFSLSFRYPTRDQMRRIRRVHDDGLRSENADAGDAQRALLDVAMMMQDGKITAEDFPRPLVEEIQLLLRKAAS